MSKSTDGPRDDRLNLRLTKVGGAKFQEIAKARGLRPATLARMILCEEELPETAEVVALMKQQLRAWSGALSNLNQIAKHLNSGTAEHDEVLAVIAEVKMQLDKTKRR